MSTGKNGPSYRVDMSKAIKAHLKRLHAEATEAGFGQLFLHSYQQIIRRLHADPLVFGEPLYSLPALGLQLRQALIAPLWSILAFILRNH